MARLALLLLAGCAAQAEDLPQYECTTFPIRSTVAMSAFQAPADVTNARVNPTLLPPGWTPVGGNVAESGAYVVACHTKG